MLLELRDRGVQRVAYPVAGRRTATSSSWPVTDERWTDGVEEDKGSPTSVDDRFADGQLDVLSASTCGGSRTAPGFVALWHDAWRFGEPRILVPPRDGSSLPVAKLFSAIESLADRFDVQRVVLDSNADGEHLAQRLESELDLRVTVPEAGPMCEAAGRFASLLRDGELSTPDDPEFTSHVLAAVAKTMPDGSWRFVKDRRQIDALIAATAGVTR